MTTAAMCTKVVVKSTTDEETKREATELYGRLGMSLSTAINVFLRQSIAVGGLPFTPCDPFYSAPNTAALSEGLGQEERGEVAASCTADGFDELIAAL